MPQMQLPIFPAGLTHINNLIGFEKREGRVYYFYGILPVFSHEEDDIESFRFITSQLVVSGNVKQIEISRAFGISYINVKRNVKMLRNEGSKGFFKKRKGKSAHVLTADKIKKAQRLLYKGCNASEVERKIDVKASTIRKAIQKGRLCRKGIEKNDEKDPVALVAKTKSDRAIIDSKANMGIGCTRENERVLAAFGELTEAIPEFKPNIDVKSAGVLLQGDCIKIWHDL